MRRTRAIFSIIGFAAVMAFVIWSSASIQASGSVDLDVRHIRSDDPISTSEFQWLGSAALRPIRESDLAELSSLIVEATVIDVGPAELNTRDGLFPDVSDLTEVHARTGHPLTGLQVSIPVLLDAHDVLGIGEGLTVAVNGPLVVWVSGGLVETMIDSELAQILGVTRVETRFPSRQRDDGSPPDREIEVPVDGLVDFTFGVGPSEIIAEGDRLVVFLESASLPVYGSDQVRSGLRIIDPGGVFHRVDAVWVPGRDIDGSTVGPRQLERIVESFRVKNAAG